MSRQKSHLLGDKQITSVGIFDVVAFYTLFRVHLTLIIVYICPKKVLYCSFSGFYAWMGNMQIKALLDEFWDKREATELSGGRIKQRNKPRRSFKPSSWKTNHDGIASLKQTPSQVWTESSITRQQHDAVACFYQTPSEIKAVASISAKHHDAVASYNQTPSQPTTKPQILEASISDGVAAYKATPSRPVLL